MPKTALLPAVELPDKDNTSEALASLRAANEQYRTRPWPHPFDRTTHHLHLGDARDLSWVPDESVHLIVTSPPYWTLKEYEPSEQQMGAIQDYEEFLDELDKVWRQCERVLVPGGRVCCVVGDVCVPRKKTGRHFVMPLHADIQVRSRRLGLDCLTPILWHKIANGATESEGNGAGFYGKPYQPGAVIKNDIEHIVFLRKGGGYRSVTSVQKALSMLRKDEMQAWFKTFWADLRGSSTRERSPCSLSSRPCRTIDQDVLFRWRYSAGSFRRHWFYNSGGYRRRPQLYRQRDRTHLPRNGPPASGTRIQRLRFVGAARASVSIDRFGGR